MHKNNLISGILFPLFLLLITFQCGGRDDGGGDGQPMFICTNGTPVEGTTDAANTERCTTCDTGYWLDTEDMICKRPVDLSAWTSQTPSSFSGQFYGITYGGGKFVGVGTNGKLITGSGGTNWRGQFLDTTRSDRARPLRTSAYGGGKFVTVGWYGLMFTSSDGESWTNTAPTDLGETWLNDIIYTNGKFIAVGNGAAMLTSTNGTTWTTQKGIAGVSWDLQAITYGGGLFVAVSYDGRVIRSSDGENWNRRTGAQEDDFWGVAYGGGKFVAVGGDGGFDGGVIFTSEDAATWTEQQKPDPNDPTNMRMVSYAERKLNDVIYVGDKFVAVGDRGIILTSGDGETWTTQASGTDDRLFDITHGDGKFVVIGDDGTILTSANGTSWSYGAPPGLNDIIYIGGQFVAVGWNGRIITSGDGETWTERTSGTFNTLNGITHMNGQYVIAGKGGIILTSSDGITWTKQESGTTKQLYGITHGGGQFVAVGDRYRNSDGDLDATVITSSDGVSWTIRTSNTTRALNDITYGGGKFAAVGVFGIITSSDGITWTEQTEGRIRYQFYDIAYGAGRFVVVGGGGIILTSTDGTNWAMQQRLEPTEEDAMNMVNYTENWLLGVTYYEGGQFVAVGLGGAILTSTSGTEWTLRQKPDPADAMNMVNHTRHPLTSAIYGNGKMIIAGGRIILEAR